MTVTFNSILASAPEREKEKEREREICKSIHASFLFHWVREFCVFHRYRDKQT